jgi:peptide/nickel transport system substrate-binding protein
MVACAPAPAAPAPEAKATAAPQPAAAQPTAAPAAAAAAKPADAAPKQTLKFLYERGNLNAPAPHLQGDLGREWSQLFYMTLLVTDKDNKLMPGLASSWSANADNTVYTFKINPNAVWSDGKKVTAADVKATWEWNADPRTLNTQINNVLGPVVGFSQIVSGTKVSLAGLVAKDDSTLEVTLAQPDPMFAYRTSLHWSGVARVDEIEKAVAENKLAQYFAGNPAVNGPYKIELWDNAKNEYNIVLNPKWWGTKPLIERIELRSILDPQTIIVAMENKEADAAYVLGSDTVTEFKKRLPNGAVYKPVPFVIYWYWFINRNLTDDPWLRKALQHAVDMDQIAQVSTLGTYKAWKSLFHPAVACYNESLAGTYFKYDPTLAKEELAKSKYGPTGDKVPKIILTATGISDVARAAQIMVEMWRQNLGITNVEIITKALPPDEAAKVPIGRLSMTAYIPDPINLLYNLGYSKGLIPGLMGGYKNDALDAAILAADRVPRTDPKFCELAVKAHNLFADDYMIIPYIAQDRYWFVQPWLKNVGINNSETPYSFFTGPNLTYIANR